MPCLLHFSSTRLFFFPIKKLLTNLLRFGHWLLYPVLENSAAEVSRHTSNISFVIKRIRNGCRRTKTKVLTTSNQNKVKYHEPIGIKKPSKLFEARENVWFRKWRKFSRPITEQSSAELIINPKSLSTQLEIALILHLFGCSAIKCFIA